MLAPLPRVCDGTDRRDRMSYRERDGEILESQYLRKVTRLKREGKGRRGVDRGKGLS